MSKPVAYSPTRQRPLRKPLAGLLLAAVLFPAVAPARAADADLCRSDRIDLQRMGHADEAERAVLRLEWHITKTRDDEKRLMADMMGRLQGMDATVREIATLLNAMPVPAPLPVTAPPIKTTPPAAAPASAPAPAPAVPPADDSSLLPTRLDIDPTVRLAMGLVAAVAIIGVLLMGLLRQRRGNAAAAAPNQDKGV